MPSLQVTDGATLYYELWGKGPPVVFVHALSMNCRFWDNQVVALSNHCLAVVYDQRGHGRSDKPNSGYGFENYADDLRDLIAALGLKKATVVGWSIGSWAALDYAHRYPDNGMSRLVLTGASPRLLPGTGWSHCAPAGSFEQFLENLIDDRPKATYEFYKALLNERASNHLLDWIVRASLEMPLQAFLESAESVVYGDKREALSRIDVPALIVNGGNDRACPVGAGEYIANTMRRARLVVLENSGHFPHIEQAREFNEELLRFITEQGV